MKPALDNALRRSLGFLRREGGTTSIEFVVMFPLIIILFSSAFEAGVLSTRQALLERAVNQSVRELRLHPETPPSYAELASMICDAAVIIPDCQNALQIEVSEVDTTTWDTDLAPIACRDRDNDYTPDIVYNTSSGDRIMLMRVCAVFEPVFPTAGLGAKLTRVNQSDYALVATNLFVNEPTR